MGRTKKNGPTTMEMLFSSVISRMDDGELATLLGDAAELKNMTAIRLIANEQATRSAGVTA